MQKGLNKKQDSQEEADNEQKKTYFFLREWVT